MIFEAESPGKMKQTRVAPAEVARTSIVPSWSHWHLRQTGAALWAVMRRGERIRALLYLFMPCLSRFTLLGGFAATIKSIVYAYKNDVPPADQAWIAGGVFVLLLLAAFFRWSQATLLSQIRGDARRVARKILSDALRRNPVSASEVEQKRRVSACVEDDPRVHRGISEGLSALLEMAASLLMLGLLIAVVTFLFPIAGVIVIFFGLVLLAGTRLKVTPGSEREEGEGESPKKEFRRIIARLVSGDADEDTWAAYEKNSLDETKTEARSENGRRQSNINLITGIASAVVIVSVFLLVANSAVTGLDAVTLVVFVLALRLSIMEGSFLLRKWGGILTEKKELFLMSRFLREEVSWPLPGRRQE